MKKGPKAAEMVMHVRRGKHSVASFQRTVCQAVDRYSCQDLS